MDLGIRISKDCRQARSDPETCCYENRMEVWDLLIDFHSNANRPTLESPENCCFVWWKA